MTFLEEWQILQRNEYEGAWWIRTSICMCVALVMAAGSYGKTDGVQHPHFPHWPWCGNALAQSFLLLKATPVVALLVYLFCWARKFIKKYRVLFLQQKKLLAGDFKLTLMYEILAGVHLVSDEKCMLSVSTEFFEHLHITEKKKLITVSVFSL